MILGTTICRELKRDFPEAQIHFYTNAPYAELIHNNPDITRVHESPDWNYDQIFIEMVREDYDRIYAPYQVRGECNAWHQWEQTRHQHLVDFYWKRMGCHRPITDRECYLFPSENNFKTVEEKFFGNNRVDNGAYVALHSTSGVASKDWPYFEQLTREILKDPELGVVQVGGRNDKIIPGACDLRGKMNMLELAAFLSKCVAFVGLDSGLSYMADAMKVPSIVIQGSTNPITSGPISPRVIHLFAEKTGYDDCQVVRCHANCRHEINCNTKITVEMVIGKIRSIKDGARQSEEQGINAGK